MYAQKNIRFGDELTFDYCSFTESEKEYQNSVCLCGSDLCRGYYLSCNRKHFHVFSDAKNLLLDNSDKCFLIWNAVLLKSCLTTFDPFKQKLLMDHSIGDNIFKNAPDWLKTWAYLVLEEISKEKKALSKFYFFEEVDNVLSAKIGDLKDKDRLKRFQIENLFEQRLLNLIITLDKTINFLDRQKRDLESTKPLILKNQADTLKYSKNLLQNILKIHDLTDPSLQNSIEKFLNEENCEDEIFKMLPLNEYSNKTKLLCVKYLMLLLSEHFRKNSRSYNFHPAVTDILYFHSMTKITFTMNQFSGFDIEIDVRDCDLTNPNKLLTRNHLEKEQHLKNINNVIYKMKKKIAASYLWGQLVFWNKQTIEKPEASLSAGRRGTLTYPEVIQSFLSRNNNSSDRFPGGSRRKWLDSIRDKPGDYWPIGDNWSYLNVEKVYGTFLSDDFFLDTNNRFAILENIDNGINFKLILFKKIWKDI